MEITFVRLYLLYFCLIAFVGLALRFCQHFNKPKLFRSIGGLASITILFMPIYFQYFSGWPFSSMLVRTFSPVTGILFSIKLIELTYTYDWNKLQHIRMRHLAIEFTTFPRVKYEDDSKLTDIKDHPSPTFRDHILYLIVADFPYSRHMSSRRQNLLCLIRSIYNFICLRFLLRFTPMYMLELHSRNWQIFNIEHFLTYMLFGFIVYYALGMIMGFIFSVGGLIWHTHTQSLFPHYPFLTTGIHDFWSRRWNAYVKQSLHRFSFVALPKLLIGHTAPIFGLCAFVLSGILHEFMYSVSMGKLSGKNMLFFIIHALIVTVEVAWRRKRRDKHQTIGMKLAGWTIAFVCFYLTAFLFCDPWVEAGVFTALKTHLG